MVNSYKIPSKKELEQSKGKGRKGILKHFILRHDLDKLVTEYSKKLGVSQASILEEMILVGVNKFEQNHGFRVAEKLSGKRTEDLTEQLNEKLELLLEEKKKNASKKANDIAEAYSKKIVHDYDGDEWQCEWSV
jgi:regulator of PEP synthase PpsR (kinase-PPPase family)